MNFPDDTKRHAIIGATGSGKTQAALWHLSHRNFHTMPWLIYDFKRDESINSIPHAIHIDMNEVPVRPGVYVTHPMPEDEEQVEGQMRAVWKNGATGIYVDEGFMLGRNNRAFRSLLTQGRSKRIPMMILSQRPVWLDRFVFSESDFYQVFRLQHSKDRRTVEEFVPADLGKRLPEFHSYYYDVGENRVYRLGPVPKIDTILNTFERRLQKRRNVI